MWILEKFWALDRAGITFPISQMKRLTFPFGRIQEGLTLVNFIRGEEAKGAECVRGCTHVYTAGRLHSCEAWGPQAELDVDSNSFGSSPFLLSCHLLITTGTCNKYRVRFCWAWRGPSSLGSNEDPWAHPMGSVYPMWEAFTWEQNSDTSPYKKGRVRHKQDITPLLRLTEKAFIIRHKLHMFLVQRHLFLKCSDAH